MEIYKILSLVPACLVLLSKDLWTIHKDHCSSCTAEVIQPRWSVAGHRTIASAWPLMLTWPEVEGKWVQIPACGSRLGEMIATYRHILTNYNTFSTATHQCNHGLQIKIWWNQWKGNGNGFFKIIIKVKLSGILYENPAASLTTSCLETLGTKELTEGLTRPADTVKMVGGDSRERHWRL